MDRKDELIADFTETIQFLQHKGNASEDRACNAEALQERTQKHLDDFQGELATATLRIAELKGERDKFEETLKRTIAEDLGDIAEVERLKGLNASILELNAEADEERERMEAERDDLQAKCETLSATLEGIVGPAKELSRDQRKQYTTGSRNWRPADCWGRICEYLIESEAKASASASIMDEDSQASRPLSPHKRAPEGQERPRNLLYLTECGICRQHWTTFEGFENHDCPEVRVGMAKVVQSKPCPHEGEPQIFHGVRCTCHIGRKLR